jgi:hypothetical protein
MSGRGLEFDTPQPPSDDALLWSLRAFIYQHFADTARAPTAAEAAARFGLSEPEAAAYYAELHQRHALFLDPATGAIRMANPFSGVPTPFRVHARGRAYFANCAWDALGLPAALGAPAEVEAACAHTGEPFTLTIGASGLALRPDGTQAVRLALDTRHSPHVTRWRIHFLVPFRRWYDDLVFT